MNAKILYILSQAGRKASILAGGNGEEHQTVVVGPEDAEIFKRAVEMGVIESDSVVVDLRWGYIPPQDRPLDACTLLDLSLARQALALADKIKAERETREATEVVLRDRKVATREGYFGSVKYSYLVPAWPNWLDIPTTETPDAKEWIAVLAAEEAVVKEAARLEDEAIRATAKARADAEKAEKEQARLTRRAERGLEDDEISLDIEDGALSQVPPSCWESHSRGKNWLARISVSPSSPGGLSRDFFPKAKGSYYYLIEGLSAGDAVEFGADYYSGRGRKSPSRWYGIVVRVEPGYVVLREATTGKAACKAASKLAV